MLIITPGETTLIAELNARSAEFSVENLLVGDAHIRVNDVIMYVFERKAKSDLDASIKDGRYHEQKTRLIQSGIPRGNIIYVIEQLSKPEKRVWSAITHSYHRDGFGVFQTKNVSETCDYLLAMCEAVEKHPRFNPETCTSAEKLVNVNIKKGSVEPGEYAEYALTLIPGVSKSISACIMVVYKNMRGLLAAVETNRDEVIKCISEIKHGESNRKIGKLSIKIVQYLDGF